MVAALVMCLMGFGDTKDRMPLIGEYPERAMDFAFIRAQEESLMSWLPPRNNTAFMEAMPLKAARAILKMQTSPYWRIRDCGQRELRECGPGWNYWALHIPVPEVWVRAEANLFYLSECQVETIRPGDHKCCSDCWGIGAYWDFVPFDSMRKAVVAYKNALEERGQVLKQQGVMR